ncbi:hypothetical protein M2145_001143 [Lachnospiraceae bacterium PF1-21]|uniref:hypothetical protein n=1 Tax=Ohessyouella blattaphilus TaxID=2949333 RepID=UPI003E21693E
MAIHRNYNSKEEFFTKRLAEIFNEYTNDDFMRTTEGIFYDSSHLVHYFTYLYGWDEYKDFLAGLIRCDFGIYFLEMINDYLIGKWGHLASKYTLTAFAGALYNTFTFWSTGGYVETPALLSANLTQIFNNCECR